MLESCNLNFQNVNIVKDIRFLDITQSDKRQKKLITLI
jgi:hypothetical protein